MIIVMINIKIRRAVLPSAVWPNGRIIDEYSQNPREYYAEYKQKRTTKSNRPSI